MKEDKNDVERPVDKKGPFKDGLDFEIIKTPAKVGYDKESAPIKDGPGYDIG